MPLLHSTMVPLGTKAMDFNLTGIDGKEYSIASFSNNPVLVIIFMCNHCPYVKAVIQRLVDLQSDFSNQGVRLVGINCNDAEKYPDDSFENMKKFSKKYNFEFPYLYDSTQEVAKKFKAICTPDFFGFNKKLELHYRGRIDSGSLNKKGMTLVPLKFYFSKKRN